MQNASGLSSTEGKIILHGVEEMTVCFSYRPMRLAGHMLTKNFVPMWSEGQNSFLKDPPNATLSILQGKDVTSTVVTLRNPQLSGNDLTYDVTLLEGSLPENAGPCSLFIDIIGCPLTPMSFAGAARRGAFLRGAYYGGELTGPLSTIVPVPSAGLTAPPPGATVPARPRAGAAIPLLGRLRKVSHLGLNPSAESAIQHG